MTAKDATDDLARLLAPPKQPVEAPSEADLALVESLLSTALPADYKRLLALYGTGMITGHLHVMNPRSTLVPWYPRLRGALGALCSARRQRSSTGDELNAVPYPLFPEAGGLLPWGFTTNGDSLCWLTKGRPEAWTVVAETRAWRYAVFPGSMSEFLLAILSGRLSWGVYEAGDTVPRPTFTPAKKGR
jgi:hypothetical protein